MRLFTFNGASSDGVFKTNSIRRQLLAPIVTDIKTIRGKGGGIAQKSYLDVREIEIDVTILRTDNADLRNFVETVIVPWLYTDTEKNLYFTDEPNRIYKAKLSGDTAIEDLIGIGECTLKFICADPFKYRNIEQTFYAGTDVTDASFVVSNTGTAPTYPKVRIVPTVAISWVKVTNQTTGKMFLLHNVGDGSLDAWDVLIVDCNLNRVYDEANGTRRDYLLDLTSEYFPLAKGDNTLLIETNVVPSGISARIIYTERYY